MKCVVPLAFLVIAAHAVPLEDNEGLKSSNTKLTPSPSREKRDCGVADLGKVQARVTLELEKEIEKLLGTRSLRDTTAASATAEASPETKAKAEAVTTTPDKKQHETKEATPPPTPSTTPASPPPPLPPSSPGPALPAGVSATIQNSHAVASMTKGVAAAAAVAKRQALPVPAAAAIQGAQANILAAQGHAANAAVLSTTTPVVSAVHKRQALPVSASSAIQGAQANIIGAKTISATAPVVSAVHKRQVGETPAGALGTLQGVQGTLAGAAADHAVAGLRKRQTLPVSASAAIQGAQANIIAAKTISATAPVVSAVHKRQVGETPAGALGTLHGIQGTLAGMAADHAVAGLKKRQALPVPAAAAIQGAQANILAAKGHAVNAAVLSTTTPVVSAVHKRQAVPVPAAATIQGAQLNILAAQGHAANAALLSTTTPAVSAVHKRQALPASASAAIQGAQANIIGAKTISATAPVVSAVHKRQVGETPAGALGTLQGVQGTLQGIQGTRQGVQGTLQGVQGTLQGVQGSLAGVAADHAVAGLKKRQALPVPASAAIQGAQANILAAKGHAMNAAVLSTTTPVVSAIHKRQAIPVSASSAIQGAQANILAAQGHAVNAGVLSSTKPVVSAVHKRQALPPSATVAIQGAQANIIAAKTIAATAPVVSAVHKRQVDDTVAGTLGTLTGMAADRHAAHVDHAVAGLKKRQALPFPASAAIQGAQANILAAKGHAMNAAVLSTTTPVVSAVHKRQAIPVSATASIQGAQANILAAQGHAANAAVLSSTTPVVSAVHKRQALPLPAVAAIQGAQANVIAAKTIAATAPVVSAVHKRQVDTVAGTLGTLTGIAADIHAAHVDASVAGLKKRQALPVPAAAAIQGAQANILAAQGHAANAAVLSTSTPVVSAVHKRQALPASASAAIQGAQANIIGAKTISSTAPVVSAVHKRQVGETPAGALGTLHGVQGTLAGMAADHAVAGLKKRQALPVPASAAIQGAQINILAAKGHAMNAAVLSTTTPVVSAVHKRQALPGSAMVAIQGAQANILAAKGNAANAAVVSTTTPVVSAVHKRAAVDTIVQSQNTIQGAHSTITGAHGTIQESQGTIINAQGTIQQAGQTTEHASEVVSHVPHARLVRQTLPAQAIVSLTNAQANIMAANAMGDAARTHVVAKREAVVQNVGAQANKATASGVSHKGDQNVQKIQAAGGELGVATALVDTSNSVKSDKPEIVLQEVSASGKKSVATAEDKKGAASSMQTASASGEEVAIASVSSGPGAEPQKLRRSAIADTANAEKDKTLVKSEMTVKESEVIVDKAVATKNVLTANAVALTDKAPMARPVRDMCVPMKMDDSVRLLIRTTVEKAFAELKKELLSS